MHDRVFIVEALPGSDGEEDWAVDRAGTQLFILTPLSSHVPYCTFLSVKFIMYPFPSLTNGYITTLQF